MMKRRKKTFKRKMRERGKKEDHAQLDKKEEKKEEKEEGAAVWRAGRCRWQLKGPVLPRRQPELTDTSVPPSGLTFNYSNVGLRTRLLRREQRQWTVSPGPADQQLVSQSRRHADPGTTAR